MIIHSIALDTKALKSLESDGIFFSNRLGRLPKTRDVSFADDVKVSRYAAILGGKEVITIGSYSYTWSSLPRGSTIGNYCSIASGVSFMGVKHPLERFTTSAVTYDPNGSLFVAGLEDGEFEQMTNPHERRNPLVIEDDVWIGEGVLLSHGVRVGKGSVVAARSIVTKDVPPYSVVAGSPARVVKMRFPEPTIARLTECEWSAYDVKRLPIKADVNIDDFISTFEKTKEDGRVDLLPTAEKLVDVLARHGAIPESFDTVTQSVVSGSITQASEEKLKTARLKQKEMADKQAAELSRALSRYIKAHHESTRLPDEGEDAIDNDIIDRATAKLHGALTGIIDDLVKQALSSRK